jgi:hypothetical protein
MSLSWSSKRQLIILGSLTLLGLIVIVILILPFFTKAPTCFDNRHNGTEQGVDCGGSCSILCNNVAKQPLVLWARSFPVTSSVYNVVAYIENQNVSTGLTQVNYEFRLYDENNLFITLRSGTTYIGKEGRTAIFEGDISVGNKVPKRTTFAFTTDNLVWTKIEPASYHIDVRTDATELTDENTRPKLSATLLNDTPLRIDNVSVVAILYGPSGNAIGTSNTFFESLLPESDESLYYTWPNTFLEPVSRIELIPRFNPFTLVFPAGYVDTEGSGT